MRYLRRTAQSSSKGTNSEFIISLIKKVIETIIANAAANNNQQSTRERDNFNQNKEANLRKAPTQKKVNNEQGNKEVPSNQGHGEENGADNGITQLGYNNKEKKGFDHPETILNEYEEILAHVKNKGIAEVIKEIYHGVTITVSLINGQSISGEVIGLYNNILILRSVGVLNYVKGEAIVSFS